MRGVDLQSQIDENNYQEFRRESGISSDTNRKQVLENLQLFDDYGNAKRGGVLFFSAHPEQYFFQAITRCVHFKGIDKVYILDDKTFGGPLLQQYKQAVEWVQGKLSVSYLIEGTGPRREIWEIPLGVFKEAILNSLSHRDYYEQGANTCIEIYDDRIEISNPGGLLPLVAKDFGRRSLTRNPLVFSLFTRMHLVEHVGSGIMRMRQDMLSAGLPEPAFTTEGFFTVTLSRHNRSSIPQPKNNANTTNKTQQTILNHIQAHSGVTATDIISATGIKKSAVYSHLKKMKQANMISKNEEELWVSTISQTT